MISGVSLLIVIGFSITLPVLVPGFLSMLIALLAVILSFMGLWSTRSLRIYEEPIGMQTARVVLEATPVPLIITDLTGKILFANPSSRDFGIPAGEHLGLSLASVLTENDRPLLKAGYSSLRSARDGIENLKLTIGGAQNSFPVTALMTRIGQLDFVVVCLVQSDQLDMGTSNDHAPIQAKMDALSHGIQGPLLGISEVGHVLGNSGLKGSQLELMEHFRQSSEILVSVLEDLRHLVDLEAGRVKLADSDLRLGAFMDGLVAEVGRNALGAMPLVSLIDHDVPEAIKTDPACLKKVLSSLVTNAVAEEPFSEMGVHLSVTGRSTEKLTLSFVIQATGEPRRSMPVGRSNGPVRSLAIAQQFARRLGGVIDELSDESENHGWNFQLQAAPSALQYQDSECAGLRGAMAMLVDRPGFRRKGVRQRLMRLGMQLQLVPDGHLAVAQVQRPQDARTRIAVVVILDDLDGTVPVDVVDQLRKSGPHAPVVLRIVPAGEVFEESEEEGFATLSQPLFQKDLGRVLQKMLRDWTPLVPESTEFRLLLGEGD